MAYCPCFPHSFTWSLLYPNQDIPPWLPSPPLLQGGHRCSAGLSGVTLWLWLAALPCLWWTGILSQTTHSHIGAAFPAGQLLSPASFQVSVIYTPEADFRGTLEKHHVFQVLGNISKEFKRGSLATTGNLQKVSG